MRIGTQAKTKGKQTVMGMAASQARFLGLTARKTNVEFEGQQINQQRTSLSNQSANYYNDLLGMSVPTPPSVDEYTQTVYTFEDGALTNEITAMIAQPNGTYTISYLSKWQDDYVPVAASTSVINVQNGNYYVGTTALRILGSIDAELKVNDEIILGGETYPVLQDGSGYYIEKTESVKAMVPCTDEDIANFEYYLFNEDFTSAETVYKNEETGGFYKLDEDGTQIDLPGITEEDLIISLWDETETDPENAVTLVQKNEDGTYSKEGYEDVTSKQYLTDEQIDSITNYAGAFDDPTFSTMTREQIDAMLREEAAWAQQLEAKYGTPAEMWYIRYVSDSTTGSQKPYFYKKTDIDNNANQVDENGNILNNINCYTIGSDTKVEEIKAIEGCRVERDSSGRFISIHIPNNDGTGTYTEYALTTTTVTDQDAYNDAMNEYEHEKYLYDQAIQDINAKIEIIQAQDKNLELRLKQLDTEQSAIQTEMDAVQKVIEKNTESTFKTFG